MDNPNPTPESLRAEAERLDDAAHSAAAGLIYIMKGNGSSFVHKGNAADARHIALCVGSYRRATEAEVTALCVIPEFKAYLKKVRGEA